MTSIGPYHEKTNMKHMFNKGDLRGPLPQQIDVPNSLSWMISMIPEFSKFRYILRLSKLDNMFCDQETSYTLFIPTDELLNIPENVLLNMDLLTARKIVQGCTLRNRITTDILQDNPCSLFITLNPISKLLITNINNNTIINNNINLIQGDIMANNGIIHITDGLIIPYNVL
jgi:hypothetical protein